jgi:hypothetical protein
MARTKYKQTSHVSLGRDYRRYVYGLYPEAEVLLGVNGIKYGVGLRISIRII